MRAGLLIALALTGCGDSRDPERAPRTEPAPLVERPPAIAPTAPAPYAKLTPRWSSLRTRPSCFYFSGPNGRDTQLTGPVTVERDGERVALHIGDATFTGTYRRGELDVSRSTQHTFNGRWTVRETIRGRYRELLMQARYHYEECQDGDACPGRCTLDADLVFAR